jgi:hypothetical protein
MNAVTGDRDTGERTALVDRRDTQGEFEDAIIVGSGAEALKGVRSDILGSSTRERVELPMVVPGDLLVGERAGRIHFLSPSEVDYIEADSNYVKLHAGQDRYINRDSVTRLAGLLKDAGFLRISRAILLNLQRVSFAEREGSGVLAFVMRSGARVVSSAGMRLEPGALLRIAHTRGSRSKGRGNP